MRHHLRRRLPILRPALLAGVPAGLLAAPAFAASVTILSEQVHYRVQADGRYDYTVTTVTRYNDADAAQRNRTIPIWFDATRERIDIRLACIDKPDGRRSCLPRSGIRIKPGVLHVNGTTHANFRAVSIPFAQLAAGDVIRLVSHTSMFRPPAIARQFNAQLDATAEHAPGAVQLSVDMPATLPLRSVAPGFIAAAPQLKHGRRLYRWQWDGHPIPPDEPGAVDSAARRAHVMVSTYADYPAVARTYDSLFQAQARPAPALTKLAASLVSGISDRKEQALALYQWMQDNIRYQAIYDVDGGIIPRYTAAQVYRRRQGDCKDQVILLQTLLRAAGIDSSPALMDLRPDNFSLPDVPAHFVFNHVIVYVPSLDLYLDPTFTDAAGAFLPNRLLDKPALLTRTGQFGHTPVQQEGQETRRWTVSMQADGSAVFAYDVQATGLRAALLRHRIGSAGSVPPGTRVAALLRRRGWSGAGTEDFDDTDTAGELYTYRMQGRIDRLLPPSGPLALRLDSALHGEMGELAAKLDAVQERTQPFLCDGTQLQETAVYTLPPGFALAGVPPDVDVQAGVLRYTASYRRDGPVLEIARRFERGKRGSRICTPEDFARMRPAIAAMRADLTHEVQILPPEAAPAGQ